MTEDYTLLRSHRRTLTMELTRDGRVVVHAPLHLSAEQIDKFVAAHAQWLLRARQRQAQHTQTYPEPTAEELERLRIRAKTELPPRVAYWSERTGLVPTGIRITSARSRFGSCSGKNSLCFSLFLMRYPPECIDLVIVHELCHIRHRDHGREFYALLASILPDWRERMQKLK